MEIPLDDALSTPTEKTGGISIAIGAYTITVSGAFDPLQLERVLKVLERR